MSEDKLAQMEALLKKSLIKIRNLEAELKESKNDDQREPIAIVGIGCRMPGGINSPDKLWSVLESKKDLVTEIPKDRWDVDKVYHEDQYHKGTTNSRHGTFLEEDVRTFDAPFFGISPREAISIDPLQRLILEVTHEALERGAIAPTSLKGSKTGVFVGLSNSDYLQARFRSGDLKDMEVYDATGIPYATAAGRLSYLYDLQGPCFALDAACASALVGTHLACESLQDGESDTAIVGAANLILTPELYVALTKLGSLSARGQCRAFDEDADGFIRGEGIGVLVMKRLSDAQRDDNKIYGVIRGSAMKHNGSSNGFTAPNPEVQLEVINEALSNAKVDPADVGFVDAHGLGNRFTDALEIQAINAAYTGTNRKDPIRVGCIKPNIGHLEAAVGVAMVMKVLWAMKNKTIPANINFDVPNKDVNWEDLNLEVPTEHLPWTAEGDKKLMAGLNLSGYSGTNVHMILEEPPKSIMETPSKLKRPYHLFQVSAKSATSLKNLLKKYHDQWDMIAQNSIEDITYTLNIGRAIYGHHFSLIVQTKDELKEALDKIVADEKVKGAIWYSEEEVVNKEVAFLFTGQGAQYHKMCEEYYLNNAVYKSAFDECAEILKDSLDIALNDLVYGADTDPELINKTIYTQPALFAVDYALAKMWMSWGLAPSAVIGHSVGEFVALTIGGVLSLKDALTLIANRGRLMQALPEGKGGMAAVLAGEGVLSKYLDKYNGKVDIAAVNSPKSLTVSGNLNDVNQFVAELKEDNIKAIPLKVSHAFHSHLMDPMLEEFAIVVDSVRLMEPKIPVISNLSGKELKASELNRDYFKNHIRKGVRFYEGIKYLDEEFGIDIFLEAGPNPTLVGLGKQSIDKNTARWLPSAKKGKEDWKIQVESLQQLVLAGVGVDWKAYFKGMNLNKIELPTYAWDQKVYWADPVKSIPKVKMTPIEYLDEYTDTELEHDDEVATKPEEIVISPDTLMDIMQKECCKILALEPGTRLDEFKSMREQGFDSMMSGEFLSNMEKILGTKLDMSLIHVYGDLNSLNQYFIKEHLGEEEKTVSMANIVFDTGEDAYEYVDPKNWHELKEDDGWLMRTFKRIDKMLKVEDE